MEEAQYIQLGWTIAAFVAIFVGYKIKQTWNKKGTGKYSGSGKKTKTK